MKPDDNGLYFVDKNGKLTDDPEQTVQQFTEDEARLRGLLREEKAQPEPTETKAVTSADNKTVTRGRRGK